MKTVKPLAPSGLQQWRKSTSSQDKAFAFSLMLLMFVMRIHIMAQEICLNYTNIDSEFASFPCQPQNFLQHIKWAIMHPMLFFVDYDSLTGSSTLSWPLIGRYVVLALWLCLIISRSYTPRLRVLCITVFNATPFLVITARVLLYGHAPAAMVAFLTATDRIWISNAMFSFVRALGCVSWTKNEVKGPMSWAVSAGVIEFCTGLLLYHSLSSHGLFVWSSHAVIKVMLWHIGPPALVFMVEALMRMWTRPPHESASLSANPVPAADKKELPMESIKSKMGDLAKPSLVKDQGGKVIGRLQDDGPKRVTGEGSQYGMVHTSVTGERSQYGMVHTSVIRRKCLDVRQVLPQVHPVGNALNLPIPFAPTAGSSSVPVIDICADTNYDRLKVFIPKAQVCTASNAVMHFLQAQGCQEVQLPQGSLSGACHSNRPMGQEGVHPHPHDCLSVMGHGKRDASPHHHFSLIRMTTLDVRQTPLYVKFH